MVFDANLVLRDGTRDLVTGETAPTTLSFVLGARCLDLGGTTRPRGQAEGVMNMVVTMVLPTAPTTTYNDYLLVEICESDNLTFGYNTLAYFGPLWTFTRMLPVTITTPYVGGDITQLVTDAPVGDTGYIRWLHPDTLTNGAQTYMIVSMAGLGDDFDDATATLSGGTGTATMRGLGFVESRPYISGPNTFFRTISPTKRYLQATLMVNSTSHWGGVELMLSPYPFRNL